MALPRPAAIVLFGRESSRRHVAVRARRAIGVQPIAQDELARRVVPRGLVAGRAAAFARASERQRALRAERAAAARRQRLRPPQGRTDDARTLRCRSIFLVRVVQRRQVVIERQRDELRISRRSGEIADLVHCNTRPVRHIKLDLWLMVVVFCYSHSNQID